MEDAQNHQCRGHFEEAPDLSPLPNDTLTHLKANTGSVDLKTGRSILKGHVNVIQNGQQANADQAIIYRNDGKITRVDLDGNIAMHQTGRLLLGKTAKLNLVNHDADISDAWYRYRNLQTQITAWGHAQSIQIQGRNRYDIADATYSTCPPNKRTWRITAKKMLIQHDKGRGEARDAKLWIGDLPWIYLPYFSFATSSERKSGFLIPSLSYSSVLGTHTSVPFYWNIAPNMDATTTAQWSKLRGLSFIQEARYLSKKSTAKILVNYVPNDHVFDQFQKDNPGVDGWGAQRASLHVDTRTQWSPELSTSINYNAVTDDYFLQQYHSDIATVSSRHLLQQGQVNYLGDYWQMNTKVQRYQTLQPLGQTLVTPVYALMPQITFAGEAPIWHHLVFGGHTQFTYFDWPNESLQASGQRTIFAPYIAMPAYYRNGSIIPKITLHATYYDLQDINAYQPKTKMRTLPILQLNADLALERNVQVMQSHYRQTLEPRMMLLYTPYQYQNHLPLFDTTLVRFTYDSIWDANRFDGEDRIADNQQISLGLQSRFLTLEGEERLRLSTGIIAYFHDRRMGYCQEPDCFPADSTQDLFYTSRTDRFSPIANNIEWKIDKRWSLHGDLAYDEYHHSVNNAAVRAHYATPDRHVYNFGYFIQQNVLTRGVDGTDRLEKDHLVGASASIPVSQGWLMLGGFSYNLVSRLPQSILVGSEYDSCCWAVRLVGSRTQSGLTPDQRGIYNNSVFLQLLLKGLGSVSNASPDSVLINGIPGYQDAFNQRGIL